MFARNDEKGTINGGYRSFFLRSKRRNAQKSASFGSIMTSFDIDFRKNVCYNYIGRIYNKVNL